MGKIIKILGKKGSRARFQRKNWIKIWSQILKRLDSQFTEAGIYYTFIDSYISYYIISI
jgi:hypothetical protein